MTTQIDPPTVDNEVDRHRFYAQVSASMNSNAEALGRAFSAIKDVKEALEAQSGILGNAMAEQSKVISDMRTTGRNLVWMVAFLSSALGWYVNRIVMGYEDLAKTVERLDRQAELRNEADKRLIELPDQVMYLRQMYPKLRDELDKKVDKR